MKSTKIDMFAMANDTPQWAICVDGYYGLFASKEDAETVYATVGGRDGDDGLADTPFGSSVILPPGFLPKFWSNDVVVKNLSDYKQIDVSGYIKKGWEKWSMPLSCKSDDSLAGKKPGEYLARLKVDLELNKEWVSLFGKP